MNYHEPVLKEEVKAHLKVQQGKNYIDATLGDGGHTMDILRQGGNVLGIDISEISLNRAKERIESAGYSDRFTSVLGNFRDIDKIADKQGFDRVSGILYDLGYSSYQLDIAEIGLSFQKDEPLDMRMDTTLGVTAADLVNSLSEKELTELISSLSGEHYAKMIAKRIVEVRSLKKLQTTKELSDLINSVVPPGYEKGRIDPATRTFQALRIAVNDELNNLGTSLPRAERLLLPGGRIIVISFHSLEDRIVKQFGQGAQPLLKIINKKPIKTSEKEIKDNVRSRSALMRVFEKDTMAAALDKNKTAHVQT